MAAPVVDIALAYDPVKRRCDVVFNGRDFALDATPVSATLFSFLADRRAHPDDKIDDAVPDWSTPSTIMARRGWPGDYLSPTGTRSGSRFWLLGRAKADEATRQAAEGYAAECFGWLETVRNLAVQVTVRWVATFDTPALGVLVQVGRTRLQLTRALA
ncbi:MAG: phage GP46 family protein [Acidiphilium sp.]